MAIRTFATTINDAAYTKVGDNVTVISFRENYVGSIKVVVTDVGDDAPEIDEVSHIPVDGVFAYNDIPADIWVLSSNGSTTVYGMV